MPNEESGLSRLGGGALVVGGLLFLVREVLAYVAGPPPGSGAEILAWVTANQLVLALGSEVLFFATMSLVPGVMALYRSLGGARRALAAAGCGVIAAVIPLLAMLLVVQGRLIYPMYGLRVDTPAVAEFVVATYYGGVHAVLLLMAGATAVLSVSMWRSGWSRGVALLGFVTTVLDIAGSYPDRIGAVATLSCGVFFAAWFAAVGVKLYRPGTAA